MRTFERYYNAIRFLEGLSNLPLDGDYMSTQRHEGVYLKRMRSFLQLIGNPEKGMKYIHITGTSGKGSVTNTLHEILHLAGKNVGSFTSPFVTTSIEKIRVGSLFIDPHEFADIVDYLKPYIDTAYMHGPYGRPSYFEIFLAIAFVYFKQKKCEWVVLEVGLGGRFDATNIIERPVVTAITTIDYDHTHILGNSLKKIAYDKAGIIKKGCTFFTTEQRPALIDLFAHICTQLKVKMVHLPSQIHYREYNRALVTAIARHVGIADSVIHKGIQQARLQCRFEIMHHQPYIVLDGAHNRSKIRSTLSNLKGLSYRHLHLVIGMAENKDDRVILQEIVPHADAVYISRFQIKERKCAHPKKLAEETRKHSKRSARVHTYLDPQHAFNHACTDAKKDDLILVVGSFFLAGEIRQRWYTEEWILKHRKSFKHQ